MPYGIRNKNMPSNVTSSEKKKLPRYPEELKAWKYRRKLGKHKLHVYVHVCLKAMYVSKKEDNQKLYFS